MCYGWCTRTRETDLLEPDKTVHGIDAIVLSGGSAFGLDATNGVVEYLREQGKGFAMGPFNVPIVPTAIIFDLRNGEIKLGIKIHIQHWGDKQLKMRQKTFS